MREITPYFITPDERVEIWETYLELGSFSAVAKALNRDRETVTRHIKCPEFEAFHAKAIEDAGKAAVGLLKRSALTAVKDWIKASSNAAEKGDHRPAKDWLTATGDIKADNSGNQQQGFIVVNGYMPNGQALPDPFASDARIETVGNGQRQVFDTKDAGLIGPAGSGGSGARNGGESDPEQAP